MKTYTIEELDAIFEEDTYPYVALYSDNNKVLVHYPANTMAKKGKESWERVKKRLQSKGLPDGFYMVKGKSSPDKKCAADVFCFKKGNISEKDFPVPQLADTPAKPEKTEHVLTYTAAIQSNKEISELTAEVNRLKMENKQKDECIAELEQELEDSNGEIDDLAEGNNISPGKQYLEDLLTTAIPIVDRYFDIEEKKIAMKERLVMPNGQQYVEDPQQPQQPQQPKQPQQPQRPSPTKEDAKEFWDKMAILLENDPEEYQRVMQKIQFEQVANA